MIIKDIKLTRDQGKAILSATCKIRKIGWDELYFSSSDANYEYIIADGSPFAAALLIPAMRLGEDLIIKDSISRQLYDGMQVIMDEVLSWDLGLKRIAIKADALTTTATTPQTTATFFSGGVDSFYTYLKHTTDRHQTDRVGSFILVKGFDIPLADEQLWQQTLSNITSIADTDHVQLLTVESNIREVVEPLLFGDARWDCPWEYIHGGCLAATGLYLRGLFRKIYIPSSFSVAEQLPWGSHLALDGNWSTEQLQFVHDGVEATRVEKVLRQIAKSPLALKHLRVCYVNPEGVYNCGHCDKCLRTMVSLYAAGVLEKAETFPSDIDTDKLASGLKVRGEGHLIFHGENQNLAALRDRNLAPDLQAAIIRCMDQTVAKQKTLRVKLRARKLNLQQKVVYADAAYLGGHTHSLLLLLLRRH